ncbi:hypothetical protein Bbelb_213910 [Branchiostoma belcheri]|nr:hypothetical protein Bbelb_213910 [Branchiostoma belcheri]
MAAASSSLGTQIQEDLTCSICLGLFTRPKVLPCQHTFCQDCLQHLTVGQTTFQCPVCRKQVRKPPQGVQAFPNNLLVTSLQTRIQEDDMKKVELKKDLCPLHPSEEIKLYCQECNVPVCNECLDNKHSSHSTISLKKAAEERKASVQVLIDEGRNNVATYHAFIKSLTDKEKTLKEQKQQTNNVSDQGEIYVANRWNHRIQVFTLQGTFVHQFPTVVSGGQKMEPNNVAVDGKGNLWVVGETKLAEFAVQYTKQGRVVAKIDLQKTGWVRGVAVDTRRNHILITQTTGNWDNLHGEVRVFRPDGTLVRALGGKKNPLASLLSRQQRMKHPWYITVDGEGNIFVSDCGNHCIHVYNEDRQFLYQFGGSGEGQLQGPMGLCTDRAGNVIVVNGGNSRVEMFDKTGRFLQHITTDLAQPCAVAMATEGQLVVSDLKSYTVNVICNTAVETAQEDYSGTQHLCT